LGSAEGGGCCHKNKTTGKSQGHHWKPVTQWNPLYVHLTYDHSKVCIYPQKAKITEEIVEKEKQKHLYPA
jgi:hypothetical protein